MTDENLCTYTLRENGYATPRTCRVCGLGPCRFGHGGKNVNAALAPNGWQDIATAPKDQRIDILAKRWDAHTDKFEQRRFADCSWQTGDDQASGEGWSGLSRGWRATHWIAAPHLPSFEQTGDQQ